MYELDGFEIDSQEVIFATGCTPEPSTQFEVTVALVHFSQLGLLHEVMDHFDCDYAAITLAEEGYINIQVFETADSQFAEHEDIEAWKAGQLRLWIVDYTGYLREVIERCGWHVPENWQKITHTIAKIEEKQHAQKTL